MTSSGSGSTWVLPGDEAAFEHALHGERLRSQSRCGAITALVFVALSGIVLLVGAFPDLIAPELRPDLSKMTWPMGGTLLLMASYETGVCLWLMRLQRQERTPKRWFAYAHVLIEITSVTAMLGLLAVGLGPLATLAGAGPLTYFLFVFLTALNLDWRLCAFAGTVAAGEFVALSLALLGLTRGGDPAGIAAGMLTSPHQYVVRGLLLLLAGWIGGYVAHRIQRQVRTALQTVMERDRAISIFGQHVSPKVAELLLRQPVNFSGEERKVCVMFLDIRDFTRMAAEREPTEVVDYLNTLFGFMIAIVNEHGGIVNKFLGDGFMAVFGAPVNSPRACQSAVQSAREILDRVELLNREGRLPLTRLGIGLHTGQAVAGNLGSAERKEYTIVGDVVNLASRIEQATKQFQGRLLVSEAVWQELEPQKSPVEDLGLVELKGHSRPVHLFKLA